MFKKVSKFLGIILVASTIFIGCQKEVLNDVQNEEVVSESQSEESIIANIVDNNAFGYKEILGDIKIKERNTKVSWDGPIVYDNDGNAYETFFFDDGTVKQTWLRRNYASSKISFNYGTLLRRNVNFTSASSATKNRPDDLLGQIYGRYFEYKALSYGIPAKPSIVLFKDAALTIPIDGWRLPTTIDLGYIISEVGGADYVADPSVLNMQLNGFAFLQSGQPIIYTPIGQDGFFWLTDKPNPNPYPGFDRFLARISVCVPAFPYPIVFFGVAYDYSVASPNRTYHNIRLVIDRDIEL